MKIILVPLTGTEGAETTLDTAFTLARRFNSHVELLHVRPDAAEALHATSMALPGALRNSVLEVGARHAEETAAAVFALVKKYTAEHGIQMVEHPPLPDGVSAAWHEVIGKESLVVALRGRLADLTVLQRPDDGADNAALVEAALMDTGKPVLLLPPQSGESIGRNIVIAWNGSTVAAKAVAAARHFMITGDKVTVLAPKLDRIGYVPAADRIEHLGWHGVEAKAQSFDPQSGSTGRILLKEARDLGADLLVMGGFGTSMTRELILGGVTRHMLAEAELPLFMVH